MRTVLRIIVLPFILVISFIKAVITNTKNLFKQLLKQLIKQPKL
jgi:hypothetical protein